MKKTCSSKGKGTREGGDSGRGRGSGIVSGKANFSSFSCIRPLKQISCREISF